MLISPKERVKKIIQENKDQRCDLGIWCGNEEKGVLKENEPHMQIENWYTVCLETQERLFEEERVVEYINDCWNIYKMRWETFPIDLAVRYWKKIYIW